MSISPTPVGRARRRRMAGAIVALAAVLGLTLPVALGTAATPTGPVTNYLKYVGGTPGKANPKLKPVVIGVVNQQGGQVEIGPN